MMMQSLQTHRSSDLELYFIVARAIFDAIIKCCHRNFYFHEPINHRGFLKFPKIPSRLCDIERPHFIASLDKNSVARKLFELPTKLKTFLFLCFPSGPIFYVIRSIET